MTAFATALRWDVMVQARNGFYWATAFVVLVVGGLLLAVPAEARADRAAWVPALLAVNLLITTFFFVAALMLLERDEGTLTALAVSPFTPGRYLAVHIITLSTLATIESAALVWIAFDPAASWLLILFGAAALGAIYTAFGAAVATRYATVNALLLPASAIVTLLLLPLLPHFGLAPRALFLLHPIEPPLTLIRAAYGAGGPAALAFGAAGSAFWTAVAFRWARPRVGRLMRDTRAGGGR
jgi:fluoroquinolone transport system permease protein